MPNHKRNIPTLQGQEAIDLWLKGKDLWNEWVDENKVYNIDFVGVDFRALRAKHELKEISFANYRFPKGDVSFHGAEFGNGDVSFHGAEFGNGDVSFIDAEFGEGNISFIDAEFGEGSVIFFGAKFGKGDVSFYNARFGMGDVSFVDAEFGEGNISFICAEFGEGLVSFHGAEFGEGLVFFREIKKTLGRFDFRPSELKLCTELDMSGSTIEAVLDISGIDSPVVLNLSHTKLSFPIDIDNVKLNFRWANQYFLFRRAINETDSTSFRRLKKLAKEADDHERALDFYAKEMRTAYWHYITGPKLALYYLYDWISDYGRSIWRPSFGLALVIIIFAAVYMNFATSKIADFSDGLVYSAGNAIPFYSGSRIAHAVGTTKLFDKNIAHLPDWIPALAIGEGIISGIFIFLIILALRNRFRS